MEKVNFNEIRDSILKIEIDFFNQFFIDFKEVISKFNDVKNKEIKQKPIEKDTESYKKDFAEKLGFDLLENSKIPLTLPNYFKEIKAYKSINSRTANFLKNQLCSSVHVSYHIPTIIYSINEFLSISFQYLEDDYYLAYVKLYNINRGFYDIFYIKLDQKYELNKFIYSINKLLN